MKLYERELFLYRLIDGRFKHTLDNGISIYYRLTPEVRFAASQLYGETLIEAGYEGLYTDDELRNFILLTGFWTEAEEKQHNELPKAIEENKIEIFNRYFDKAHRESIRKRLRFLEGQMGQLIEKRHQFDWITCEGIATHYKLAYYIEHCTYYEDGRPYDWQHTTILSFLSALNRNSLTDSQIRELSRTEPWQSIWRTSTQDCNIFNKSSIEITDEQRKIILWSEFYDNIHENPECPGKEILEDDDALDGWLILQHRKRDKQNTENMVAGKISNQKIANADEVYVIVNDEDEAKKIDELNNSLGKMTKRQRIEAVKQRGELQEHEMPDSQQKLRMMATEAYSETMKRKK